MTNNYRIQNGCWNCEQSTERWGNLFRFKCSLRKEENLVEIVHGYEICDAWRIEHDDGVIVGVSMKKEKGDEQV